jgi:hypothetical protein
MTDDKELLKIDIANSFDPLVGTNLHGVTSQNTVMFVFIIPESEDFRVFLLIYACV